MNFLRSSYDKIKRAADAYGTLGGDEKRFVTEKVFEASRTPSAWLQFLQKLSDLDRQGDAARAAANRMAFDFAGAGILLALILAILVPAPWIYILPGLEAFFVAAVIWCFHMKGRLQAVDLPGTIPEFIVPVISILREDMAANESLTLRLDLRQATRPEKQHGMTKTSRVGPRKRNCDESHFVDSWFSGTATLADGAALRWRLVNFIRRRKVNKGKKGTQVKYKIQSLMEARLGFPAASYEPKGALSGKEITLKSGAKRNQIRIRRIVQSTDLGSKPGFDVFVDAVSAAYRQVKAKPTGSS